MIVHQNVPLQDGEAGHLPLVFEVAGSSVRLCRAGIVLDDTETRKTKRESTGR